ncbi:hypothetical protein [Microbacterium lacticum]|nr:hypothetical protein [Microbacterium lacticum]
MKNAPITAVGVGSATWKRVPGAITPSARSRVKTSYDSAAARA